MKNITISLTLLLSIFITSCGELDHTDGPFSGKIEFTAGAMVMSTDGSITIDADKKTIMYQIDIIKDFMGADIVTMIDMENKVSYSISPEDKIYTKYAFSMDDFVGDLPTEEDVNDVEKELFSHLKKTGNSEDISGYKSEEYELTGEVEGVQSGTVWFSKELLDRIKPIWVDIKELEGIGLEKVLLGFPMKAQGTTSMGLGNFSITNIIEGEDALTDLNLDEYVEMEQDAFMKKIMEGSSMGNMFDALGGMDDNEDDYSDSDFDKELEEMSDVELENAVQEAIDEMEQTTGL